jgi:pimeloyl-ACP methyl ester carboxylesterase
MSLPHPHIHRDAPGRAEHTLHATDGTRLHAVCAGPAAPRAAVLLVHGVFCSSEFWVKQFEPLAQELLVVAIDQRGHGRSGRPGPDGIEAEVLGADVDTVARALLPAGLPAIGVGHSLGGIALQGWAAHTHGRADRSLHGLVLIETTSHHVIQGAVRFLPAQLRDAVTTALLPILRRPVRLSEPVARAIRPLIDLIAHAPDRDPADLDRTMALIRATNPRARVAFLRFLERVDIRHAQSCLDLPTLVVAGDRDRLTPHERSVEIAEAAPKARLITLPGQAHMAPFDAPDAITQLIYDFALNHTREGTIR